ncbi:nuclear transport factor 2 family protein [Pusillimonas sp. SM2304]|uniref:nuclear transport factor 2 family protein n=1 Tax=Pusillimonas sp. SM2304 TaxID=3073241 RepID=UPI002875DCF1|nr:nuclear transport factor 2 family protein [Pusillimonas sp. SM2304]MDS1142211.1 nuclear transport factor 2 family protein [Pusillimonas sp. SM2304]
MAKMPCTVKHSENAIMPLSLPTPVSTYFEISNGLDIAQVFNCFTQDAVVADEGQTYQGHAAIQTWQREAQKKFEYTVEPVSMTQEGGRVSVTAHVAGNFPGSPVQLGHVFELAEDKIKSLKIG